MPLFFKVFGRMEEEGTLPHLGFYEPKHNALLEKRKEKVKCHPHFSPSPSFQGPSSQGRFLPSGFCSHVCSRSSGCSGVAPVFHSLWVASFPVGLQSLAEHTPALASLFEGVLCFAKLFLMANSIKYPME